MKNLGTINDDKSVLTKEYGDSNYASASLADEVSDVSEALSTHSHDERYYTESEIDTKLSELSGNFQDGVDTVYNATVAAGATPADRTPSAIATAIGEIESSGGTDVSDTTATAGDVLVGKEFYTSDGTKTEGTIPTAQTGVSTNVFTYNDRLYLANFAEGYYHKSDTNSHAPEVYASYANAASAIGLTGAKLIPDNTILGVSSTVTKNPTLTVSGATVTAPAGYYSQSATKTISTGALADATWSGATATVKVGTAGYLATSASKPVTLTTNSGGTKYATTSAQTLISSGSRVYLSADLKIGALSQSGISKENIANNVNVYVSNGSTKVWDVTGTATLATEQSGTASPSLKGSTTIYSGTKIPRWINLTSWSSGDLFYSRIAGNLFCKNSSGTVYSGNPSRSYEKYKSATSSTVDSTGGNPDLTSGATFSYTNGLSWSVSNGTYTVKVLGNTTGSAATCSYRLSFY